MADEVHCVKRTLSAVLCCANNALMDHPLFDGSLINEIKEFTQDGGINLLPYSYKSFVEESFKYDGIISYGLSYYSKCMVSFTKETIDTEEVINQLVKLNEVLRERVPFTYALVLSIECSVSSQFAEFVDETTYRGSKQERLTELGWSSKIEARPTATAQDIRSLLDCYIMKSRLDGSRIRVVERDEPEDVDNIDEMID
jgi:hypothetical protein